MAGSMGSTTEIRRTPGRTPVNGRFAPGDAPNAASVTVAPSALDLRLMALSELNAHTSKTVTSFEREVSSQSLETGAPVKSTSEADPAAAGSSAARGATLRSLFKRRAT
jgi:hypothetical protein